MADFDLTQTDQQVQNILNDGQSAMGAGAQTTLTTEYIMLKDTNGVYHKILKSSFTEAIRDVLAGLLVNNDKGTTISQIAAIASGDFGSITPANLASVLGVNYKTIQTNDNLDDEKFKVCGNVYICISSNIGNSVTNTPNDGRIGAFRLEIVPCAGTTFPMQRLYRAAKISTEVYVRYYEGSWGSWQRLDNFGCNTLAELKAALANV